MSDDREAIENRTHALEAPPAQFTFEHFCLALGLLQELGAPFHISVDEGVLDDFLEVVVVGTVVVRRFLSSSPRQGRQNVDVLEPAVVAVVVHRPFPLHSVDSRIKSPRVDFARESNGEPRPTLLDQTYVVFRLQMPPYKSSTAPSSPSPLPIHPQP